MRTVRPPHQRTRVRQPGPHQFDADHQMRRRAYVRRQLTEAAAVILAGLEHDEPLGEILDHAEGLLGQATLETLVAALGDEHHR